MILVTGGTGLVGSHLLYKLLQGKAKVRAIYRREKTLETVKRVFSFYSKSPNKLFDSIEWIQADITDIPSLEHALKDIIYVYHCAAFVSFEPDKYYQLRKINIEGTANVVNLCLDQKIKKLCYVSSVAALGNSTNNKKIDEETYWNPEEENSVYGITKYGAEMEVWRGIQEGLQAVIVNPTVIIGPGIWSHGSGYLIKKVYTGMSYYTKGSIGLVDIHDVVNIMTELMSSNISNERFILISENWSYKEFFNYIAKNLNLKSIDKELHPFFLKILNLELSPS